MSRIIMAWSIVCLSATGVAASGNEAQPLKLRFADKIEARGETLTRLKLAYGRLCSTPLDNLDFVLSDVNFKFNRRFTNYSGDISGRMLGALNACEEILGCKSPMIDKLIEGFAKYQKPDGHFGADQNLDKDINQLRDMAILWGNGRLLLAMAERLARVPDPQLKEMAVKLGDYCISTRKYYGKENNFKGVGGIRASGFTTCYPSLVDGLAALGEVTGDMRFVNEAAFIARLSLIDRKFKSHHSHGRLTAYRGMLDIDRITGGKTFTLPLAEGRVKIMDTLMLPTGGVTEYFDLNYGCDEGCSEADWLRVNTFAWRGMGEAGALDVAEHILRNHLHSMQFSKGGFGHWVFRPLLDGREKIPYGGITNSGSDSYWCCSMHGTQVLADMARWGVAAEKGKVYVTWLGEVRSTIKPSKQSSPIVVTTSRTGPGAWTVEVRADTPTEATLALRVPRMNSTITVDGKRVRGRGSWADRTGHGGWALVIRKWSRTSTLKIDLPIDIRFEKPYEFLPETSKAMCVLAGADLYCLPDEWLTAGFIPSNAVPGIVLSAKTPTKDGIPVLVESKDGKVHASTLAPMSSKPLGGARWVFRVKRVDADAFAKLGKKAKPRRDPGKPVELEFGCDGKLEIYLNGRLIGSRGRCHVEGPQFGTHSARKSNVVAIRATSGSKLPALIGLIRAGGKQYTTGTKGWSVIRVGDKIDPGLLTDAAKGADDAMHVSDVGPLGMPPWQHVPGEFFNTGARWIWGKGRFDASKKWWLFRYRFEIP